MFSKLEKLFVILMVMVRWFVQAWESTSFVPAVCVYCIIAKRHYPDQLW